MRDLGQQCMMETPDIVAEFGVPVENVEGLLSVLNDQGNIFEAPQDLLYVFFPLS